MRDIKFRAWDKIENKMWYPDAIRFDLDKPLNMKSNEIGGWVTFFEHEGLHDPIMQYTNIKDKNGKEIYEGDIIQNGYEGGEVYFKESEARFNVKVLPSLVHESKRNNLSYWHGILSFLWHNGKFEIIGNIYENPELLK